jgi:phosphatidylglycerophosphate synthase
VAKEVQFRLVSRVARRLKQQSDFGMMLDYTIDIVTQVSLDMQCRWLVAPVRSFIVFSWF